MKSDVISEETFDTKLITTTQAFASFAPHALKGQKLLAQGSALGYYG